ncbi:MAG: hypothetical protein Q9226_007362, partial [Calogaya cf. arnoldii]
MSSLQQHSLQPPPDGDTSAGPSILIITWLFTAISTIIVGLKVYTRLKIIRQFGADDILTILALLFLLAFAPLITVSVDKGLGKHVYYLTPEAPLSAFTHIFLAVVPIFGLWKIRIKTKTKVGVCLLMGTTVIAAIAAIIKTYHISEPELKTDFT